MERPGKEGKKVVSSGGLSAADFTRIAANGFGDPQNAYCHAMAYFQDRVYVGTTRHSMALLKLFPPLEAPAMEPWPVQVPGSVQELDMRGQIWCWTPASAQWENVYTSPVIMGRNDQEVPRDLGYRGMAVFQGRSDPEPALYVSCMSTVLRGTAARILRSVDGEHFSPVSEPGLGNPNISTFRSLIAFDNHLFVPPTGEGITFNTNKASVILRSADPVEGQWELACEPGFGDATNNGIFELEVFNDHLYAGTFNPFQGYQIWKTPMTGTAPCCWTKVMERGAYRGQLNEIAMSMCPFNGALYVGSAIQNGGYDHNNMVGPASGEIIRIYPDDSWELVVGSPRRTPAGMKYPLSGMGPGFDNIFAGYIWRMAVHEGWLYASTFDWSVFLPYARRPSQPAARMMREFGVDHLVRVGGGFELWRTRDGINWIPVTQNGLGNPYNYGARNLVSTPYGLFVGTANPFAPEVPARLATGWVYIPNPHGGAEVWLGQASHQREDCVPEDVADGRELIETLVNRNSQSTAGASPAPLSLPRTGRKYQGGSPRVLLTGATGFIGSHVLEQLLQREARVRILALPETVQDIRHPDRVEVVIGSLTDEPRLTEAVQGIETIYHLAARLPGSSPNDLREVNVRGTESLLRAVAQAGTVHRFVFTSSAAVYEGAFVPEAWPLTEASPLRPQGPEGLRHYGRSKVAAESLVQRYAKDGGFEYVMLRPTTCYGVGSAFAEALVHRALTDSRAGQSLGAGLTMQLVHVRDLAEVIVQAGTHLDVANDIFNVAGIEAFTYRSMASIIRRLGGLSDWTTRIPDHSRVWQRYVFAYDVTKAQRRLGFMPRVTMQEGLEELVAMVGTQDTNRESGAYARRWWRGPGAITYPGQYRAWQQRAALARAFAPWLNANVLE
jgi:nucleoside-diphosphate-sugar epimerase